MGLFKKIKKAVKKAPKKIVKGAVKAVVAPVKGVVKGGTTMVKTATKAGSQLMKGDIKGAVGTAISGSTKAALAPIKGAAKGGGGMIDVASAGLLPGAKVAKLVTAPIDKGQGIINKAVGVAKPKSETAEARKDEPVYLGGNGSSSSPGTPRREPRPVDTGIIQRLRDRYKIEQKREEFKSDVPRTERREREKTEFQEGLRRRLRGIV